MSDDSLDDLLAKLNSGDTEAAERVFLAYEPYLRMVVRRRLSTKLRAKFDSMDIVQSVWADLLEGLRTSKWKFENAHQIRAFLMRVTQNRLIDGLRHHRRALQSEVSMTEAGIDSLPETSSPRVSEEFYADELWRQMLDLCPPAHYELLRLKRQGVAIAEIAERTHLHEGSVRRILYDVARRLEHVRANDNSDVR